MSDIEKNIKATLYDRITNPLFSTFFISFLISNWKAIYISIFISQQYLLPNNKLEYILNHLYNDPIWNLLKIIVFPALSTYAFIWVLPPLIEKAYSKDRESKANRRKIKIDNEEKNPVSRYIYNKVIKEHATELEQLSSLHAEKEKWTEDLTDITQQRDDLQRELDISIEKEKVLAERYRLLESNYRNYKPSIDTVFSGKWECESITKNGQKHSEIFFIQDGYKYCTVSEGYVFDIDQVNINPQNGTYNFRKVNIKTGKLALNVIYKRGDDLYEGIENGDINVFYRKLSI